MDLNCLKKVSMDNLYPRLSKSRKRLPSILNCRMLYFFTLFQRFANTVQRIFNYCSCNCCIDKSTQNIESFAYSARILSGFCRRRHRISSICNSTARIFVVLSRKFDSSPLEKRVAELFSMLDAER